MQTLRPYQTTALYNLRLNIRHGVMAQVLQLATGGGKTTIASAVMAGAVGKGNRAYFVVDSLELVEQSAARFEADGMSVGIIQGDHYATDYSKPVQVATIQTLKNRWPKIADWLKPNVLVIDECHCLHRSHIEIMAWAQQNNVPVIGLSATPFRKGLGKHFSDLVVGATTAELTEQGYLVPAKCYAPFVPDLKGVKTNSSGDWQDDALAELMGDAKIVGDVVTNWLKLAEGRQTLVFAANVAHSRLLAHAFKQAGVKSEHIDGYDPDKTERSDKIRAFRNGDIQVLCNCAILTKGFDAPETGCVVVARPTKSLMLHIQIIGRGLRTAPGKTDCIVIDHAGNCLRNGLPTDSLPDTLDMGNGENPDRKTKEKSDPIEKQCANCGFVSTKHTCPSCGFAPEFRQDVEVKDGELYQIESGETQKFTTEQLERFYSELLGYAKERGYSSGWAWHKVCEYAGRAPRSRNSLNACPPSQKTRQIIQHLNIKNAKRREKHAS